MGLHPAQIDAYRRMSPARKLELGAQLWSAARALKAASLRARHPEWSAAEVESEVREIFLYART